LNRLCPSSNYLVTTTIAHPVRPPRPRAVEITGFDVKTPVVRGPHGDENHLGSRAGSGIAHNRDFSHRRQCRAGVPGAVDYRRHRAWARSDFHWSTRILGNIDLRARLHTFPHRRRALTTRQQRRSGQCGDCRRSHLDFYSFHSSSLFAATTTRGWRHSVRRASRVPSPWPSDRRNARAPVTEPLFFPRPEPVPFLSSNNRQARQPTQPTNPPFPTVPFFS